jgi:hypothetical protein
MARERIRQIEAEALNKLRYSTRANRLGGGFDQDQCDLGLSVELCLWHAGTFY